MKLLQNLNKTLLEVYKNAGAPFSGLGILVSDRIEQLPLAPLYNSTKSLIGNNLHENLLELSSFNNSHHDGFHVLSSRLEITHIAQYFYPKPIKGITLDANSNYGARYYVAQAGSKIPNVLYTAIIGRKYGVCIFKNGKKIKVQDSD